MNIIRLTKGQKAQMKVEHPLLDGSSLMTEKKLKESWGDKDAVILGHLYFVKIIVGRFLANWPETRRFVDDMVSEGILSVTEYISGLESLPDNFQAVCWTKIRVAIENMLNRDRSMFAAPTTIQWELDEPKYNYTKQIDENLDGGESALEPEFVDILDELEHLASTDQEALRLIIYHCMEQDHGILEDSITHDEAEVIDSLTKAITEM